jgi:hypothetical protein
MADSLRVAADTVGTGAACPTIVIILAYCFYAAILFFVIRAIVKAVRKPSSGASMRECVSRLLWVTVVILSGVGVRIYDEFSAYYGIRNILIVISVLSLCVIGYFIAKSVMKSRKFAWYALKINLVQAIKEILWVCVIVIASCCVTSEFFVSLAEDVKAWTTHALNLNDYIIALVWDLTGLSFITLKVIKAIKA